MPKYVVLSKQEVRVGDAEESRPLVTWIPVLSQTAEEGMDGEVRLIEADNPEAAIDIYAHTVGGELDRPGSYKAVSWGNWRGVVTLQPKTETDRTRSTDE